MSKSTWKYIHKIDVNDYEVYLAISETGKIRIGSKKQLQNQHMPSFFISNDQWVTLLNDNFSHTLLHLKIIDGALWCNLGKDLGPDDKEYPFFFMTRIRQLAIQKKAQEIEDKHDDHLRQQRLLHGI